MNEEQEIEEIKEEWKALKARLLNAVLGSLVVVGGYAIWVGNVQSAMNNNSARLELQSTRIADIDKRQQLSDITSAEIRTKLVSIEATLVEIKQEIKKQK